MRLYVLFVGAAVLGCGPTVANEASSTSGQSSTSAAAESNSSSSATSASSVSNGAAETTGTSGITASSSTGSSGLAEGDACDYLLQDCGRGLKCVRVDLDGDYNDERICVPVVEDGGSDGEPCTRDPRTGIDDCGADTICAHGLPDETRGKCVEFCMSEFLCADANDICIGSSSQGELACFPTCDPIAPECGDEEACQGAYPTTGFVCRPAWPDADATAGQACIQATESCPPGSQCFVCASGYGCLNVLDYGPGCGDPAGESCCTEYCSLDGGVCSNPLHECRELSGEWVGGYAEGVGLCGVREDFDWCTDAPDEAPAGVCPPPDLDPNIPWCSPLNTEACSDEVAHLGGGQCWCHQACDDVSTCPVPSTGSAEVSCDPDWGCSLLCDGDEECPDGMDCHFASGQLRCFWLTP